MPSLRLTSKQVGLIFIDLFMTLLNVGEIMKHSYSTEFSIYISLDEVR
jgi:hypothetical protein